jgi:Domain of unknown function (DUF4333)
MLASKGCNWGHVLPAAVAAAFATLAFAAPGCGSDTLDTEQVESSIEEDLSSATTQIKSVSCPSDVDKEEGAKFNCTAKLSGGGKATVIVTQTNDRGDVTYAYKPGSVVLADDAVEPVLEDALAQRGLEGSEVDCPSEIAVKVGETVQCSAQTASGGSVSMSFTFTDDSGSIDSSSVETNGQ